MRRLMLGMRTTYCCWRPRAGCMRCLPDRILLAAPCIRNAQPCARNLVGQQRVGASIIPRTMEKVKAGLRGMRAEEKVVKGRVVHDQLNGNPNFPNPVPSLIELNDACARLHEANVAAMDRGRKACALKRSAESHFDLVLSRLAAYVNSACQGDVVKLSSSGFSMAKRPEPVSSLAMRGVLWHARAVFPGQVELRWDRVPGALIYEVEMKPDGPNMIEGWKRVCLTSRPRQLVSQLEPNSRMCFRVRAIGTKTESPYSQVLFAKAAA